MPEMIELTARDGHKFAAYKAKPAGHPKAAIIVVQEIFGVNSHIKSVADAYAAAGYLAIAPALYDRAQRGYETGYAPEEIQAGVAIMQTLKMENTLMDVDATLEHARASGKVGIVGYCWGGTVAWVAAARTKGLACSVPYYGGGIFGYIGEKPSCPVMFQFGEQDKSPTPEQARQVVAAHPNTSAHFYDAGHGFNCDQRGSYNASAAALAKTRSLEFFAKHLAAS